MPLVDDKGEETMKTLIKVALFLSLASGFLGQAYAQVDESFKILAGDVLQISVWKEEGMDRELVVMPDGTVSFPLVGSVLLQGLTLPQAQEALKQKLKKSIPDAAVTVMVKAPMGHTISVLGQVAKPGDIVISKRMNVMQALSQAGGLTPFAEEGDIVVLRNVGGKKTSIPFPYDDIAAGRDFDQDVDLVPGDVVFVPTSGLF